MKKEMVQQEATDKRTFGRKFVPMFLCMVMILAMSVPCFAAEATPVDMSGLLDGVTGSLSDFSTANLTTILIAGVGIAAGLVLLWFGFNYVKRKLMGALRKGKL